GIHASGSGDCRPLHPHDRTPGTCRNTLHSGTVTPMLFRLLTPLLAAAILMSPLAGVGWAQASFQAIELEAPERIRTVLTGDFDGDGDGDIAAAYVEGLPPAQTRLLTVFWQTAPGTWERT